MLGRSWIVLGNGSPGKDVWTVLQSGYGFTEGEIKAVAYLGGKLG